MKNLNLSLLQVLTIMSISLAILSPYPPAIMDHKDHNKQQCYHNHRFESPFRGSCRPNTSLFPSIPTRIVFLTLRIEWANQRVSADWSVSLSQVWAKNLNSLDPAFNATQPIFNYTLVPPHNYINIILLRQRGHENNQSKNNVTFEH